jgi:hypothetical protein
VLSVFALLLDVNEVEFILRDYFFCFWWDWGLDSGLHSCKVGTLPLEPLLQSILLWLFWNYLPWLALNHDSPNLSLPSS